MSENPYMCYMWYICIWWFSDFHDSWSMKFECLLMIWYMEIPRMNVDFPWDHDAIWVIGIDIIHVNHIWFYLRYWMYMIMHMRCNDTKNEMLLVFKYLLVYKCCISLTWPKGMVIGSLSTYLHIVLYVFGDGPTCFTG